VEEWWERPSEEHIKRPGIESELAEFGHINLTINPETGAVPSVGA